MSFYRQLFTRSSRMIIALAVISSSFLYAGVSQAAEPLPVIDPPQSLAQPGGSGTEYSPYRITTCEELRQYGIISFKTSQTNAILLNDLNCPESSTWGNGVGFPGISRINQSGFFDGRGHTISQLHIYYDYETDGQVSWGNGIGFVRNNLGTIRNLTLDGGSLTATFPDDENNWASVGSIVGYNDFGKIYDVHTSMTIATNGNFVGGLVGAMNNQASNSITQSSSTGSITSTSVRAFGSEPQYPDVNQRIGGLIGYIVQYSQGGPPLRDSTISSNWTSSDISATDTYTQCGGFIGYAISESTKYENNFASGTISCTGTGSTIGGFLGYESSTTGLIFKNSFTTSNILATAGTADPFGFTSTSNGFCASRYALSSEGSSQCSARIDPNVNPTYFENNSVNAPLDLFDFSTIWDTQVGLPSLQNAPIASEAPQNFESQRSVDGTSATLSWDAPIDDGGSAVTTYYVRSIRVAQDGVTYTATTATVAGTNHTFDDLGEDYEYLFTVAAINNVGIGVPAYTDPINNRGIHLYYDNGTSLIQSGGTLNLDQNERTYYAVIFPSEYYVETSLDTVKFGFDFENQAIESIEQEESVDSRIEDILNIDYGSGYTPTLVSGAFDESTNTWTGQLYGPDFVILKIVTVPVDNTETIETSCAYIDDASLFGEHAITTVESNSSCLDLNKPIVLSADSSFSSDVPITAGMTVTFMAQVVNSQNYNIDLDIDSNSIAFTMMIIVPPELSYVSIDDRFTLQMTYEDLSVLPPPFSTYFTTNYPGYKIYVVGSNTGQTFDIQLQNLIEIPITFTANADLVSGETSVHYSLSSYFSENGGSGQTAFFTAMSTDPFVSLNEIDDPLFVSDTYEYSVPTDTTTTTTTPPTPTSPTVPTTPPSSTSVTTTLGTKPPPPTSPTVPTTAPLQSPGASDSQSTQSALVKKALSKASPTNSSVKDVAVGKINPRNSILTSPIFIGLFILLILVIIAVVIYEIRSKRNKLKSLVKVPVKADWIRK